MAYKVSDTYKQIIYSQDDTNDIKIWFNEVELENAGIYCENLTRTARIMSDDGKSRFSIDNFIATKIELILHNIDTSIIQDQVKISIGTLIDEENSIYEYVPLGIFNIQDTPTTDNGKTTIVLRDNRIKFDKPYNAKPLIDENGGSATKKQILDNICETFGVENEVTTFNGENDLIGIYDNTINGNIYVSYIAEQGGYIPAINRDGKLIFVDLSDLYTWRIPLSVLGDYKIGMPFTIQRVVYESGTIKYETSDDTTLDTLYLNSANPYINNKTQVETILNKLNGFKIDSVTIDKVLGNPAIDPYDLIQVYIDIDENGDYLPEEEQNQILFTTFANTTYTFNGIHRDKFDTQIGIEERKENVTLNGEPTFRKWAKSEIDNVNGTITNVVGIVNEVNITVNGVSQYVLTQDTTFEADKDYYKSKLTEDTTYLADKDYYKLENDTYIELREGIDYNVGDNIEEDTIYEFELLKDGTDYNVGDNVEDIGFQVYESTIVGGYTNTINDITSNYQNLYDEVAKKANADDVNVQLNSITESVTNLQTNTYTKTEIQQIANGTYKDENGKDVNVSAVISEVGQFDKDGMLIQKEDGNNKIISDTVGRFNEKGVQVREVVNGSASNEIFFGGYVDKNDTRFDTETRKFGGKTVVYTNNLISRGDTIIGTKGLFLDYQDESGNKGTGFFAI